MTPRRCCSAVRIVLACALCLLFATKTWASSGAFGGGNSLRDSIRRRRAERAAAAADGAEKEESSSSAPVEVAKVVEQAAKAVKTQAARRSSFDVKKVAVQVSVGGVSAAAAVKGFHVAKTWLENRRREKDAFPKAPTEPKSKSDKSTKEKKASRDAQFEVDPNKGILEILSSSSDGLKELLYHDANSSTVVLDANPASLVNHFTVIIFDCDSKLDDTTDKKARSDYFALMANLTSSADPSTPMKTLYIPGKGNKNVMQDASLVKNARDWKFVASSKAGMSIARAIRSKYGVRDEELRILVLDGSQKVVSENALDLLRINPRGMPWLPSTFASILQGGEVLKGGGSNSTEALASNAPLAVYFSASWCAPCKKFTPRLAGTYSANGTIAEGASLPKLGGTEVLFVSLDSEEDQFNSYRATMPWPAIPFRDPRRALLQMALGVKSIPALVLLDAKGKIITSSGVTQYMSDEKLEKFPWGGDVLDLDAGNGALVEALQRGPALIALSGKENRGDLVQALGTVSHAYKSEVVLPRSPREDLIFCVLDNSSKLAGAIRSLCNLESSPTTSDPTLVLLDLGNEQYSVVPKTAPSEVLASITSLADRYKCYSLALEKLNIPSAPAAE